MKISTSTAFKAIAISISLGCLLFVSSYLISNEGQKFAGGQNMNDKVFAKAAVPTAEAFPDEIKAVEDAWNEPIPENLLQIGGLDEWGWASIYHDASDPPQIFRGEYRNWNSLYSGKFEYFQADGEPIPEEPLSNFYMTHIADGGVYFSAINPKDGFYFQLRPLAQPINVDTPEAEEFRNSR